MNENINFTMQTLYSSKENLKILSGTNVLEHWYRRFYQRGFKDGMNFESWGVDVDARERFETEEIN